MKKGLKWKIVGSRLRWSVQIQRMNEKKLKKRANKKMVVGVRRGRP